MGCAIGAIVVGVIAFIVSSLTKPNEGLCKYHGIDESREGYCLTSEKSYDQLIIITGNTQNTPAPNIDFTNNELLGEALSDVFYNSDGSTRPKITVISVAGDNYTLEFDKKSKYKIGSTIESSNNSLKNLSKELNSTIKQPATEPHADYVGAILEAKNLIEPTSKHPIIIIVGSGLSDSGVLDFAHDEIIEKYTDDSNSTKSMLAQDRRVSANTLKGTTIYWYNLGNTVAPQPSMNDEKETLQKIYNEFFAYTGAEKPQYLYGEQSSKDESVKSDYSVEPTLKTELSTGDVINFTENVSAFVPDQDVLVDPSSAKEKLTSFVKKFNRSSNKKLELTGYIAFCAEGSTLGKARAETIKSILVSLGIDPSLISTSGEAGPPPTNENESYSCSNSLPDSEKRTVIIKVMEK